MNLVLYLKYPRGAFLRKKGLFQVNTGGYTVQQPTVWGLMEDGHGRCGEIIGGNLQERDTDRERT